MAETDDGLVEVRSPLQGTVVRIEQGVGQEVDATSAVVVVESMKMEYAVGAGAAGLVHAVRVHPGDAVQAGDVVAIVAPSRSAIVETGVSGALAGSDRAGAHGTGAPSSADTTGSGAPTQAAGSWADSTADPAPADADLAGADIPAAHSSGSLADGGRTGRSDALGGRGSRPPGGAARGDAGGAGWAGSAADPAAADSGGVRAATRLDGTGVAGTPTPASGTAAVTPGNAAAGQGRPTAASSDEGPDLGDNRPAANTGSGGDRLTAAPTPAGGTAAVTPGDADAGHVRPVATSSDDGPAVGDAQGSGDPEDAGSDSDRTEAVAGGIDAPSQAGGIDAPSQAGDSEVRFGVGAADEGADLAARPLRRDVAEVLDRHAVGTDAARPEAAERRHANGQRTARENVADLCDPGSFVEYGPLAIAAQRRRRSEEDLIERTPADGLVAGVGTVNRRPTAALSYDYTVLAGTQGYQNHRKKDRLFEVIERQRLPVVFFTEGGGGRPGDVDAPGVSGLDCLAFNLWGRLSGLVPMVGIASGRCFAGNAALLGSCDVVIATEGANIGMAGPAMIEGGGLGRVAPEEIGPLPVQAANGVVDVAVADEAEAVRVAKQYLSYFSEPVSEDWSCDTQARLRNLVPENRRQAYDVRLIVNALADTASVLELRRGFGAGMVTALARVEGRAVGIVANNPDYLGGAIDADGADKAARFMQLCDAFDLPLLFLCDTPGIMVGPEAEATGLVRHVNRLFVTGANLTVPFGTIILRKGYGLGAQAMAGGSFKAPLFCVAWPTGEVGGMGLEGAVRLGFRKELEAIEDDAEREAAFQTMVTHAYEQGKALNSATHFEIDDVIDPADSRQWISIHLAAAPPPPPREGKKRPYIDTW